MEIRADHQKGLSYSELGRKYNIDRRTAKKYAESESRPEYVLTDSKPSKLDPFKPQIVMWLEEAPYSAMRIWEKVKDQGFEGGYTTVKHYVRGKKEQLNEQATVRFETMPGLQAQVDWAFFEDFRVRENREEKKLYCFLMINYCARCCGSGGREGTSVLAKATVVEPRTPAFCVGIVKRNKKRGGGMENIDKFHTLC